MLAGYFVINGIKALKDPEPYAAEHERFAAKVVPLARKVAPAEVAPAVPDDAATLARISGGLQVAGGVGMILGKGRRIGAVLLALSLLPPLVGYSTKGLSPQERSAARNGLLKDIALLGGALIAVGDTEGRPGLAWRAHDQAAKLSKSVGHTRKSLGKDVDLARLQLGRSVDNVKHKVALQAKDLAH